MVQHFIIKQKPFIIDQWAPIKNSLTEVVSYDLITDEGKITIPEIMKHGVLVAKEKDEQYGAETEGKVKLHTHYLKQFFTEEGKSGIQWNVFAQRNYDENWLVNKPMNKIEYDREEEPNIYDLSYNLPAGIFTDIYVYVGENAKLSLDINSGNFGDYLKELDKLGVKRTQENGGNNDRYTFRDDALVLFNKYKKEFESRLNKDFPNGQHIFNDNSILTDFLDDYEIFKYIYAFVKY